VPHLKKSQSRLATILRTVGRVASAIKERRLGSGIRTRYSRLVREPFLRAALNQHGSTSKQLPSISMSGRFGASPMGHMAKNAFERAMRGESDLPPKIRNVKGMSGQKYRFFINNFVTSLRGARYLEVGSWAGSTAIAALYGNEAEALCIDDWSQFGGPRAEFLCNLELVRVANRTIQLVERDFRRVDYASIGTFNVFLFDGPHKESDHYEGIRLVQPALASPYLLIIDDWNWFRVRVGTLQALKDLQCEIQCSIEVRTTLDDTHPEILDLNSDWHNGYFIGVICRER